MCWRPVRWPPRLVRPDAADTLDFFAGQNVAVKWTRVTARVVTTSICLFIAARRWPDAHPVGHCNDPEPLFAAAPPLFALSGFQPTVDPSATIVGGVADCPA